MSEEARLLAEATEAFVDRRPIDWVALLSRVRHYPERPLLENLRVVAIVRESGAATTPETTSIRGSEIFIWFLAAAAFLQVACCSIISSAAWARGASTPNRSPQILLTMMFALAVIPLSRAVKSDSRSLCLIGLFACVASAFARTASHGLTLGWFAPIEHLATGVSFEGFVPACLWQFTLDFPRVKRFTSFDLVTRRASRFVWLLGLLLFSVNLLAAYDVIDKHAFAALINTYPNNDVFWHLQVSALAPAIVAILVRSRRAPRSERRKVARLALALAAGAAPFLLFGPVLTVFPSIDNLSVAGSLRAGILLDGIVLAALALTPILCSIAVIADGPFDPPALLSGMSPYEFARDRVHALSRRLLHRYVDEHDQLACSLERLRNARGRRETMAILARELNRCIGVKEVRALISGTCDTFIDSSGRTTLPADSVLVAMLREAAPALDFSPDKPLLALLPPQDRNWVRANDVRLLAPVKARDGSIAGVIMLGPKVGDSPFDRRDRWLLATLTTAAGAAWEDASFEHESHRERRPSEPRSKRLEVAYECPRCGLVAPSTVLPCGCPTAATLASLPFLLGGKFIVERRVGKGGMGVVYLARDRSLDRAVALKTLPELRPGAVERLRDEARAMAALNHEALATIYGLEVWRRTPILVVEYFPEGMLAHRLSRGPLSIAETIRLGVRLSAALAYMHAEGVLHRDLKPSNIALAGGRAKLLDFGLASRDDDEGEEVGSGARWVFAGTLAYQPPEASRGQPASPAFDLWALGVTMLEAMKGNPDCPSNLHAFFERALASQPEQRFPTALEFHSVLQSCLNNH